MIGQIEVKETINKLLDNFPRFLIITGQRGQGKKLLAKYIAIKLKYQLINCETKIDNIRSIIDLSYKQTEPIIYLISDADKMSIGAKNSLLKVIEEPPNNAYFIMTLQDINNTLPTIKSRCYEIRMQEYTLDDINKFINELNIDINLQERHILQTCCTNKYQVELFVKYGIQDFYDYVDKVVNNIWKVPSANCFKITEKIDTKNEENGYDIFLFLNTYREICLQKLLDNINDSELFRKYGNSITITSNICNKLKINGINKSFLVDRLDNRYTKNLENLVIDIL